jgi:hypothetical protein
MRVAKLKNYKCYIFKTLNFRKYDRKETKMIELPHALLKNPKRRQKTILSAQFIEKLANSPS